MPYILAIENSTHYLSLAYGNISNIDNANANVVSHYHAIHINDGNTHILKQIDILLQQAQQQKPDYIAVGIGPGAFTGVRLAISIAIGLAYAWSIKIIPICSLWSAIEYFHVQNKHIDLTQQNAIVLDARMQQAYVRYFSYADNLNNDNNDNINHNNDDVYLFDIPNIESNIESTYNQLDFLNIYNQTKEPMHCILSNLKNIENINSTNNNIKICAQVYPHALGLLNLAYNRLSFACSPQNVHANYVRNKVAMTIAERDEKLI